MAGRRRRRAMTEPDPEFDASHPSGHIVFRSCRGGYLHSVGLAEAATGVSDEVGGVGVDVLVAATRVADGGGVDAAGWKRPVGEWPQRARRHQSGDFPHQFAGLVGVAGKDAPGP